MTKLMIGKELFDWLYPIGSYYETSDTNFNPTTAGWYGTWVEDTEGQTLVSRNSGTFKNVGASLGEEGHTLNGNEIPKFSRWNGGAAEMTGDTKLVEGAVNPGNYWGFHLYVNNNGGQPHNNIQPSKVCVRWHRTA